MISNDDLRELLGPRKLKILTLLLHQKKTRREVADNFQTDVYRISYLQKKAYKTIGEAVFNKFLESEKK